MTDEGADEVKVFRNNKPGEDEESAHSSQELENDKKDVAAQMERETGGAPTSTTNGNSKVGAFSKPASSNVSSPGGSQYGQLPFWNFASGINSLHQQLWNQLTHGQAYSLPFNSAGSSPLFFSGPRLPSSSGIPPPPAHNSSSNGTFGTLFLDPAAGKTASPTFPTSPFYPFAAGVSPTFQDLYSRAAFLTPAMMGHSPSSLSPIHSPAAGSPLVLSNQTQLKQAELINKAHATGFSMPLAPSIQHMMRLASVNSNPLTSINQMRMPGMPASVTSMANSLAAQTQQNGKNDTRSHRSNGHSTNNSHNNNDRKNNSHIKKPLNAFMWFMKENRPKLMEEQNYKERQSAELNKELGRRWHNLSSDEQQKYYAMAKEAKNKHQEKFPNWTARDNYAINKKKKRKRDKSADNSEMKKCRARFGLDNQPRWCKHCKRKKRCLWYRQGGGKSSPEEHSPPAQVSSTTQGSPIQVPVVVETLTGCPLNSPNGIKNGPLAISSPSSSNGRVTSSTRHASDESEDESVDGIDISEAQEALDFAIKRIDDSPEVVLTNEPT